MEEDELPQAISSISGSVDFISLAASQAMRPYSSAVRWPICQGPSISLPRHQVRMPKGFSKPLLLRRSLRAVPPGKLQYSTRSLASAAVPVPRFTAIMTSLPARLAHS